MGSICPGLPLDLALRLRDASGANHLIESGTYFGDSAATASGHFAAVTTIELDERLYGRAKERFAGTNVATIQGRSEEVLAGVVARLQRPAIIWLDAHWSGPGTSGEDRECPILEEIRAVDSARCEHIILIDDARLFINPPGPPHDASHWPTKDAVFDQLLATYKDSYCCIIDDVILRVPASLRLEVEGAFTRRL